jgi:hypothetical protein
LFEEAQRRDLEHKRPWVMLVDGHLDQLKPIWANIKHFGVEVILILDFIHVLEYLWKAAYCFHPRAVNRPKPGSLSGLCTFLRTRRALWPLGYAVVRTLRGLSAKEREAVDQYAGYLLN